MAGQPLSIGIHASPLECLAATVRWFLQIVQDKSSWIYREVKAQTVGFISSCPTEKLKWLQDEKCFHNSWSQKLTWFQFAGSHKSSLALFVNILATKAVHGLGPCRVSLRLCGGTGPELPLGLPNFPGLAVVQLAKSTCIGQEHCWFQCSGSVIVHVEDNLEGLSSWVE